MREDRLILVAAFLLLQSGLEPATALNNHESTVSEIALNSSNGTPRMSNHLLTPIHAQAAFYAHVDLL
ncbi:hypothetical protein HPB50_026914 [Hyalomma asiaticum]|uniref:Uncharacterized protein n=1 Tax=Hyalomma asiaticum TaxID=266040 RepID=A0ACB7S3C0_HYAAI|nr:hypothetical protein HPB50_026914 [Hyalomma asiaticum]